MKKIINLVITWHDGSQTRVNVTAWDFRPKDSVCAVQYPEGDAELFAVVIDAFESIRGKKVR